MKNEPLNNKINLDICIDCTKETGIAFSHTKKPNSNCRFTRIAKEEDIKSAIEFYKEYLDYPLIYFKRFPKQLEEFWKYLGFNPRIMILKEVENQNFKFNLWLIKKSFPDLYPSGLGINVFKKKKNP